MSCNENEKTEEKCCCAECCNQLSRQNGKNGIEVKCKVYSQFNVEENDIKQDGCKYFNKNISGQKICKNCIYFSVDPINGFSCTNDQYQIIGELTAGCKNFKKDGGID